MDVGVKRRDELAGWMPKDPIRRLAGRLLDRGVADMNRRERNIAARIARAIESARAAAPPAPERVMEFLWQEAACAS